MLNNRSYIYLHVHLLFVYLHTETNKRYKIMKTVTLKNIKKGQLFIFGGIVFQVENEISENELIMCSIFASGDKIVFIAERALVQTLN